MPAVSSDLKDLMCYQIHKFEKTTMDMNDIGNTSDESDKDELDAKVSPVDPSCHHYTNVDCQCVKEEHIPKDRHVLTHHHSWHYCPEYESRVKRSRSIRFGSGGDVIIDKNHGYANTSWLVPASPPPPLREKAPRHAPTATRHSHHFDISTSNNNNNLRISLNVPMPFDLDSFLTTHSLSISINVSEKKSSSDLTTRADEVNRHLLTQTGWYYRNVDWQESRRILRSSPIGTFLVRDSSDPNYSFSLSVQTAKGPISSRIGFTTGKYRLDSQVTDLDKMPAFDTVIALVEHYIKNGLVRSSSGRQVWIDSQGQICSQVQLTKPKSKEIGSLRHLCRLVLNQSQMNKAAKLVPVSIQSFLDDYPYVI